MEEEYFIEDEIKEKVYDTKLIKQILKYILKYKNLAITAVLLSLGSMLFYMINPWLIGKIIDLAIKPQNKKLLIQLSFLYLIIEFLVFLLTFISNYFLEFIGQHVMHDLRHDCFNHLEKMPISFYDKNPVGRLVTRVVNDITTLAELFSIGIVQLFADIFFIIGVLITLLILQPVMAIVTFIVIPVLIIIGFKFQIKVREAFREVRKKVAKLNTLLSEYISGMKIIRLFNQQNYALEKFDRCNKDHLESQMKSVFYHSLLAPSITVANGICIVVILLLGGYYFKNGHITIGLLISFVTYTQNLFFPIRNISEKFTTFQGALASAERVFKLLDEPKEDYESGKELKAIIGKLDFDNVSFSYDGKKQVLQNVSFSVNPGESIAIVGHTGAGKSTIISLLTKFYEINEGDIKIDGISIKEINIKSLRKNMAVIYQDVFIFADTILENIRLRSNDITLEKVVTVCQQIGADKFINNLSEQYYTMLYERGTNISNGQRQLLSFARALCHDPKILILDEATASIDSQSEQIIQNAIKSIIKNRTSIIIAHRLSTIQSCNKIIVLHKGRVAEIGTHDELMAKKGLYYKLYQIQFSK